MSRLKLSRLILKYCVKFISINSLNLNIYTFIFNDIYHSKLAKILTHTPYRMNKPLLKKTILWIIIIFIPAAIFSQSQNMDLQANWNESDYNYNDVWGYVDNAGGEYAIIGAEDKVYFLKITNPTNPVKIAEFELGSKTAWRDIKTFGHYAYAVSEGLTNEGLVIFDLCAIEEGVVSQVYQENEDFGKAHNIFIDVAKELLYVVGANTQSDGLIVYDLSINPSVPKLLTKKTLPGGYVHDIFVKDDLAFCSHGFKGLYIYDVSNPATPLLRANLNTSGYNHSSWGMREDGLLVYAQEIPLGMPLGILDYSNYLDNDLTTIKTFKEPLLSPTSVQNVAHNPFVVGDYAVVSYYEDGVVIFDLSNPLSPERVAYYDTYPTNSTYTGYEGCWGVYPFLPSGNILASDISNGLFIIKPTFDLPNTCRNGIKDWNEENIDCGGVCASCTPCISEICDNNIDDDRDGKIDCEDDSCDCALNQAKIESKIMLEGFLDENTGLMTSALMEGEILPLFQPFKIAPYNYDGIENIVAIPAEVVDWVLVEARHPDYLDSILAKKACLLLRDGSIIQHDGAAIYFENLPPTLIHLVVRSRGHLAVMSRELLDLSQNAIKYDFTNSAEKALGNNQLKLKGNYFCLFAGDFDQNGIINSIDFNIWKQNSALVNRYLSWDVDGNGIINVLDFNYWKINRSKIGEPMIQF